MKKHNFSAGPAILPEQVMAEAAQGVLDLNESGLSVLEISHRSAAFKAILEEAEQLTRELLSISEDYAVLFLTGGASSQFFMAPMNLLNENETAAYLDTGSWSAKAIKEAKLYGNIEVIASSKADNYTYIPKEYTVPTNATYLHLTTNNTIFGTQYKKLPETDAPLVADMSSDVMSKPIDVERFGLFYAGAQKNIGPAGVTLVVVRKDLVGRVNRDLTSMLNYQTHIGKGSAFNTPPVFPIYAAMLTFRWVKAQGGVSAMKERNEAKAKLMYDEIDANPLFTGVVTDKADRSVMNATFTINDKDLEAPFLEACKAANCVGVKGHRSVGGFRASMYNAMPIESVQVLVDVMRDFAQKHG
jgi:phosphoserine aminotransferase